MMTRQRATLGIISAPVLRVARGPLLERASRFPRVGANDAAGRMLRRMAMRTLVTRWLARSGSAPAAGYAPMSLELRRRIRAEQRRRARSIQVTWPRSAVAIDPTAAFDAPALHDHGADDAGSGYDHEVDDSIAPGLAFDTPRDDDSEPWPFADFPADGDLAAPARRVMAGFATPPPWPALPALGLTPAMRVGDPAAGQWEASLDAAGIPPAIGFIAPAMPLVAGGEPTWDDDGHEIGSQRGSASRSDAWWAAPAPAAHESRWARAPHTLRFAPVPVRAGHLDRMTVTHARWPDRPAPLAWPGHGGEPGAHADGPLGFLPGAGGLGPAHLPPGPPATTQIDRALFTVRADPADAAFAGWGAPPPPPGDAIWLELPRRQSAGGRSAGAARAGDPRGASAFPPTGAAAPVMRAGVAGDVRWGRPREDAAGGRADAGAAALPWSPPLSVRPAMPLALGFAAPLGPPALGRLDIAFPPAVGTFPRAAALLSPGGADTAAHRVVTPHGETGPVGPARGGRDRLGDGRGGLPLAAGSRAMALFGGPEMLLRQAAGARHQPPWAAVLASAAGASAAVPWGAAGSSGPGGHAGLDAAGVEASREAAADAPLQDRMALPHWTEANPSVVTRDHRPIGRHATFPLPLAPPARDAEAPRARPSAVLPIIGSEARRVPQPAPLRIDERLPIAPGGYPSAGPSLSQSPVRTRMPGGVSASPSPWTREGAEASVLGAPLPAAGSAWQPDLPGLEPRAARPLRTAPLASSPFLGHLARFVSEVSSASGPFGGAIMAMMPGMARDAALPGAGAPGAPPDAIPLGGAASSAHLPVFRSARWDRPEPGPAEQSTAAGLMAGSTGYPLPPLMRRSMEHLVGADLGAVRIHSGPTIARAADLLAARAMTRGTDVFLPSGAQDGVRTDTAPLLAHELTHVAQHLGAGPRQPGQRLVLAQRQATEERAAELVERAVMARADETRGVPSHEPTSMTLARTAAAPVVVQREETAQAPVAAPAAEAPSPAPGRVDPAQLAEQVFSLLERRLIVERERGGFRR